jgi:hypothetical protein
MLTSKDLAERYAKIAGECSASSKAEALRTFALDYSSLRSGSPAKFRSRMGNWTLSRRDKAVTP